MNKEKIQKLLVDPSALKLAVEKAEDQEVKETLVTALQESVKHIDINLSESLIAELDKVVEGNSKAFSTEFSEFSDIATLLQGEWNKESAQLAIKLYLNAGHKLETIESEYITFGKLYGLDENHELYDTPTALTVEDISTDTFTLEPGCFSEAVFNNRLQEKTQEAFGIKENTITLLKHGETPLVELTLEDFSCDIQKLSELSGTEESKVVEIIEKIKQMYETPLKEYEVDKEFTLDFTVSVENLLAKYDEKETDKKKYLVPLVGLAQEFLVNREKFEQYEQKYQPLGSLALESVLNRVLDSSTEEETEKTDMTPPEQSVQTPDETYSLSTVLKGN